MPCEDSMITKVISVKGSMTVNEALGLFEKENIRCAPVVDDENKLIGMFSRGIILKHLLPVSVTMEDGLNRLDFVIGAAPAIARKLRKLRKQKVSEIMRTDVVVLHPKTHAWEAIRLLEKYGSPLAVVDEENGKLVGLMSEHSVIEEMTNYED